MRTFMALLSLSALLAVACGSDSETDTGDGSAIAPIEISELLEASPAEASVIGYVVIDDAGARLCEALAESFPPQCGGASITIANPDALTVALEQEQSTQWTNERVRLDGTFNGAEFTVRS